MLGAEWEAGAEGTPQLGLTLLTLCPGHLTMHKQETGCSLSVDSGLLTPDITGEAHV